MALLRGLAGVATRRAAALAAPQLAPCVVRVARPGLAAAVPLLPGFPQQPARCMTASPKKKARRAAAKGAPAADGAKLPRFTVALVGRPNVGKSSLFNKLVGKRLAIVNPTPGTTRDWKEAEGHLGDLEFVVMDTGGLEDKGPNDPISSKMLQHTSVAIARADAVLFMIDAREGVTDEDVTFVRWLKRLRRGGDIHLVANKAETYAATIGGGGDEYDDALDGDHDAAAAALELAGAGGGEDGAAGGFPLQPATPAPTRKQRKRRAASDAAASTGWDRLLHDCYELGLGSPVAVSAEHSFGMVDLYDVLRECAVKLQARQQLEAAAEAGSAAGGAAGASSPLAAAAASLGEAAATTADAALAAAGDSLSDASATAAADADQAAAAVIQLAIVGRPNVGKSTLVNQMLGEERVLAGPTPGLTRDTTTVELPVPNSGGRSVRLVDTAGMRRWGAWDLSTPLEGEAVGAAKRALERANVVVLVVDASGGSAAGLSTNAPVFRPTAPAVGSGGRAAAPATRGVDALAFDTDDALLEAAALAAVSPLNAPPPAPAADADSSTAAAVAVDDAEAAEASRMERAIVGRASRAARRAALAARRAGGPGLTEHKAAHGAVVAEAMAALESAAAPADDAVAAAGSARKPVAGGVWDDRLPVLSTKHKRDAAKAPAARYATNSDTGFGLTRQDMAIAEQIVNEGRALVVVLNKIDAVADKAALVAQVRAQLDAMHQLQGVEIVPASALKGGGMSRLLPAVLRTYDKWNTVVPTSKLNNWLALIGRHHPPPAVSRSGLTRAGKPRKVPVRLKFVKQLSSRPPTFALFANMKDVPETYTRFLANAIRKEFQLFGVPVRLYVRAPENPYKNRRNQSSGAKKPALSKERRSKLRLARWMANSGAKAGRRSGPATGAAQPAAAPARAEGGGDRVDKRQALPLPAVPRGGIKVKAGQRRAVQHKQQAQRRDKRSGSDARSTTAGARGGARVAASARR